MATIEQYQSGRKVKAVKMAVDIFYSTKKRRRP
jgi:hypothetical protein